MYSHISKGWTAGYQLGKRLLRTITGIIGLPFDFTFAALFWSGSFESYWQQKHVWYDFDDHGIALDSTATTFFRGVTGWVGNIVGSVIGAPVGALLGFGFYLIDGILRLTFAAYEKLSEYCLAYANYLPQSAAISSLLFTIRDPENYFSKAINVASGTLGMLVLFAPFCVAKVIEFFFPFLGNYLSTTVGILFGFLGTVAGSLITMPLVVPFYLMDRVVELYSGFREFVRASFAFIYAKAETKPITQAGLGHDCCCTPTDFHSQQFRDLVTRFEKEPVTETVARLFTGQNGLFTPVTAIVAGHSYVPVAQASPRLANGGQEILAGPSQPLERQTAQASAPLQEEGEPDEKSLSDSEESGNTTPGALKQ
jgi:hypothetical protein